MFSNWYFVLEHSVHVEYNSATYFDILRPGLEPVLVGLRARREHLDVREEVAFSLSV